MENQCRKSGKYFESKLRSKWKNINFQLGNNIEDKLCR